MMVCLTDEPLVLTIKLADRLHNMRTCHALKPDKRAAVAIETLEVWCSLAEQLGMFPLKVRSGAPSSSAATLEWTCGHEAHPLPVSAMPALLRVPALSSGLFGWSLLVSTAALQRPLRSAEPTVVPAG